MSECLCLQGKPCACPCHHADAAAVPVPDAGDETLRLELAEVLTAHLPGYADGTCGCGDGTDTDVRHLTDALLPLIRDHVAAAVQAERERTAEILDGCNERTQRLAQDLDRLIERDAARGAAIERARALTVDAVERSGYDDLVHVSDIRAVLEGRCCGLHNKNCEPPSELCCAGCTEHSHPKHPEGVTCVLEATP